MTVRGFGLSCDAAQLLCAEGRSPCVERGEAARVGAHSERVLTSSQASARTQKKKRETSHLCEGQDQAWSQAWKSAEIRQNVCGGVKADALLAQMRDAFLARGFSKEAAAIVPSPLIRATAGSVSNHMPLEPGSTYSLLKVVMDKAYKALNDMNKSLSDEDLDLQGLIEPKWGNHSWWRFCDKMAREAVEETRVTEIDHWFFIWCGAPLGGADPLKW